MTIADRSAESQAIEIIGELRDKNQITVPRPIADAIGARSGDQFIFLYDSSRPDGFFVYRVRESYAGVLAGVYGTPQEIGEYLKDERQAWDE
jgi:bifunctional DNA-binding transcriptional regulator/antitoxin component of YhaV-PrlF toxin-antitoxin module